MEPIEGKSSSRVREAVHALIRERDTDYPVSISELAQKDRDVIPDFIGTERQLADVLAREILRIGGNISFDSEQPRVADPAARSGSNLSSVCEL